MKKVNGLVLLHCPIFSVNEFRFFPNSLCSGLSATRLALKVFSARSAAVPVFCASFTVVYVRLQKDMRCNSSSSSLNPFFTPFLTYFLRNIVDRVCFTTVAHFLISFSCRIVHRIKTKVFIEHKFFIRKVVVPVYFFYGIDNQFQISRSFVSIHISLSGSQYM